MIAVVIFSLTNKIGNEHATQLKLWCTTQIFLSWYCKWNEKSLNKWNIRRKYCSKYVENSWNWCCGVLNIRTFIYFPWCHSEGWNLKKITHPQSTHTYGRRANIDSSIYSQRESKSIKDELLLRYQANNTLRLLFKCF